MRRVLLVLGAVLAAGLLALGLATAAGAAPTHYVALGDSYSAGVGADGDSSGGDCDRSSNAYPALWAAAHSPESFDFVACSGATTDDVRDTQLSALSADTTLVSMTIGGNDAGFSSVMKTCVLNSTDDCVAAAHDAETFIHDELPGRLDSTLGGIHDRAPDATVELLGYPDFYDLKVTDCIGLSQEDHVALNGAADALDGALSAAADRGDATFVDVRDGFRGHQLCDDDEWLHSIALPLGDSYHPTADGQRSGYLPSFTRETS